MFLLSGPKNNMMIDLFVCSFVWGLWSLSRIFTHDDLKLVFGSVKTHVAPYKIS